MISLGIGFLIVTLIYLIPFIIHGTVINYNLQDNLLEKFTYGITVKKVDYDKLDRQLKSRFGLDIDEDDIRTVYNSLKCQNCGGLINFNKIKQQSGFITLQCQYCKSIYYIKQSKRDI